MKKRVPRKMSLNRETLHRLTDSNLGLVGGALEVIGDGVIVKDPAPRSILDCTNAISICLTCTTPLNSCPYTTPSPSCTCA